MGGRGSQFLLAFVFSALVASAASAQEQQCSSRYTFRWDQPAPVPGTLVTRAGTPCRIPLIMHGSANITSVRIVQAPRNGSASAVGPGAIRFQPKAGFTGRDSMTVKFVGTGYTHTGASRKTHEATVTFAITVY